MIGRKKQTTDAKPVWVIYTMRGVPETNWFRCHVLRKKTRWLIVNQMIPTKLSLTQSLNRPSQMEFVCEDGMSGGSVIW